MNPVKLFTVWQGPLPPWHSWFMQRLAANPTVDWELIQVSGPQELNALAAAAAGVPCRKGSVYACCDLRPLYGRMFADRIEGIPWWGWCDLDVVLGNLENLLPDILLERDVVSTDANIIHGPLTFLRNDPEVVDLCLTDPAYKEVLARPDYCNYDETGFNLPGLRPNGNPSFTDLVKRSGLKVHFDDRSWTESHLPLQEGLPSRCCELRDGRLLEVPTSRELLMYHFTSKVWPIPNRFAAWRGAQTRYLAAPPKDAPAESPEFWENRVRGLAPDAPLWKAVYDTSHYNWFAVQRHTRKVVLDRLGFTDRPPAGVRHRLLDAGCGYGALLDCLSPLERTALDYTGVDYCPVMLDLARNRWGDHPACRWVDGDLRNLSFPNDSFTWVVCRGLEGSAKTLLGSAAWDRMESEMLRVAPRLLLIDYHRNARVVERSAGSAPPAQGVS